MMEPSAEQIPGRHTCVVGLLWGDEGKGKIVDLLAGDYDVVVRFNGGNNAGHTVCIGGRRFALHLLPAGVLHDAVDSVIGPGVVVDPTALVGELDTLAEQGIGVGDRLKISDRAHLVMPWHKLEDQLSEAAASEDERIGTTARGIGPCYADKMRRITAFRVCDLLNIERATPRLRDVVRTKNAYLHAVFDCDEHIAADDVLEGLHDAARRLSAYICDSTRFLRTCQARGRRFLFEGANGTLLDIDHGTYPYVTSSGTTANNLGSGSGVPVSSVSTCIGVTKAYATRVGKGPFVSELRDEQGDRIRQQGHEYGTTTGRPRRCGWFDAVATRYSAAINGVNEMALMHLDTLTGFERVGVCTAYQLAGHAIDSLPADPLDAKAVQPQFEFLPGWHEDISSVRSRHRLPGAARRYVDRIEELVGVRVSIVSVGPQRDQTIVGETQALNPTAPVAPGGA